MNIQIKHYTLKPCPGAIRLWDLYKTVERTSVKDSTKYQSEGDIGFGLTLEGCINKIISTELADKEITVGLSEFLKEYKMEKEEILKLVDL